MPDAGDKCNYVNFPGFQGGRKIRVLCGPFANPEAQTQMLETLKAGGPGGAPLCVRVGEPPSAPDLPIQ